MANYGAEIYEDLKAAYETVLAAITAGEAVVEYTVRGRRVVRPATDKLLATLWSQIMQAEARLNAGATSQFRLVRLSRVSARGS